jgi:hypothetical protein
MRVSKSRTGAAIVAIAAVISAVGVSACGSSGGSGGTGGGGAGGGGDPVARAASVSNSAGGYKMSFTLSVNSSALPSTLNATGTGSFDASNRTGVVNLAMNLGSSPQVAAVLGGSTLNIQEILDGTTFYIKLPAVLLDKLPGAAGKPWLSVDLKQLGAAAGIPAFGSLMSNPTSTNPGAMLQYLRAVSGGVTKVGTATVNGFSTTEYRATIDFAKYPSIVPPAERAQARQAISALEKLASVKKFPVMVWIDSNHLVRRMQFAFNETLASTGQSLTTKMTLNMTGYGPQPAPAIPPASEVTSISSLLGSLGLSTGG